MVRKEVNDKEKGELKVTDANDITVNYELTKAGDLTSLTVSA